MAVKIRNLKRKSGEAIYSVWPPPWSGSYGSAGGEVGDLVSVKRLGDGLRLTIKYKGYEYSGNLEWDAPPSRDDVETVLTAHLGAIKAIGDLDV
jgi:hypothetical protein